MPCSLESSPPSEPPSSVPSAVEPPSGSNSVLSLMLSSDPSSMVSSSMPRSGAGMSLSQPNTVPSAETTRSNALSSKPPSVPSFISSPESSLLPSQYKSSSPSTSPSFFVCISLAPPLSHPSDDHLSAEQQQLINFEGPFVHNTTGLPLEESGGGFFGLLPSRNSVMQ